MSEEIFPIVNEDGEVIGRESRAVCHGGSMLLHPVVHVHVVNSKGDLYLQRRAWTKDIQPGMWDTAVGGHVDFGESVEQAVKRECFEELGLKDVDPIFAYTYQWHSPVESELVYVHTLHYDGEIVPDTEELIDGRFWTRKEIEDSIGKSVFTPNFEHDLQLLIDYKVIE